MSEWVWVFWAAYTSNLSVADKWTLWVISNTGIGVGIFTTRHLCSVLIWTPNTVWEHLTWPAILCSSEWLCPETRENCYICILLSTYSLTLGKTIADLIPLILYKSFTHSGPRHFSTYQWSYSGLPLKFSVTRHFLMQWVADMEMEIFSVREAVIKWPKSVWNFVGWALIW